MKFLINETNETKELNCIMNGINITEDVIGNSGAIGDYIKYDSTAEMYLISKQDYNWWKEYIDQFTLDQEKLESLRENYDIEAIDEIVENEFDGINDYEDHHTAYERVFERIESELVKEI
jgi:hypothetical protein